MGRCDVAIIGAGPYGLSAAAHLRGLKGLEICVFGDPMSFWRDNMPSGMILRSNWTATRIADPDDALTLEAYQATNGAAVTSPVPLSRFIKYGLWYQSRAVPDLDRRKVVRVEGGSNSFCLVLQDGEVVRSRRVIIAAGIRLFAWSPGPFQCLPSPLVSHTSAHRDLMCFSGKSILVVGSGQSALESGALLREIGAHVEIIARSRRSHWLQGRLSRTLHHGLGKLARELLYAPTDVGPAGLSQLMARPDLLRKLPRPLQDKLRIRCVRPAGARWLLDRLKDVPIGLGKSTVSVRPAGGRVKMKLDDGTERTVDHVLLGTGYRADITRYCFLAGQLMESIERCNDYPVLRQGFETSVPGLHMLGAPAAWSFGPLVQFVSGTTYTSRALLRLVASKAGRAGAR